MKSSIYVSAEQIQVIGYLGNSVKQYVTYPLPEGTMYNGTITDNAFLTECLVLMKKEHPDLFKSGVTLIVDGSTILSRRLITPKLSNTQYLQLVRDDFADSAPSTADLVCGYLKLDASENAILGCAVNKVQVDSYISTFNDAGIKLSGIHVGVEAIINFVKATTELHHSTVVINVIDGLTMLSMLFQNGKSIFVSRTRLYGDAKEQVYQSAVANLNGLIQFTRSEKINEITHSYYLGVSPADVNVLAAFNPHTDITIGTLPVYRGREELPPESHFACLNMHYGGGIDLLASRVALDKYVKSQQPKKLWIPILAGYIFVLVLIAGVLAFLIHRENTKIKEINDYLHSTSVVQKQEELGLLMRETRYYDEILRQMDEKTDWEESLAKATSNTFDLIAVAHGVGVDVQSMDFTEDTGIMRIRATCADANVSSDYVDMLYILGVADSIEYRGYGTIAEGVFSFTIDIALKTGGVS
ncbi:MAG: hypothetical protein FWD38_08780 [Oscillospiraceae bacterium]|nr:hypothetical protein [Oscillospiraceae bacterium]